MTLPVSYAPLKFLLLTTICQILAFALLVIVWSITSSIVIALLAACFAAGTTARSLHLSMPWQTLNLILPPAVASAFVVEVPSSLYLALLIFSVAVDLPAFWTRVPYYPTPRAAYALVLAELPTDRSFRFLDIGCGMGEMLVFLAKQRPHGSFVGIEIGIVPFLASWLRARISGARNVTVTFQSMWSMNLASYDFVYAFLSPAPMERLWRKVSDEMTSGSLFISNTFTAPATPSSIIGVKDPRKSSLYLYKR